VPNIPKFKIGSTLHDEMMGDVKVEGEINGWPAYRDPHRRGPKPDRLIPVLCGDLVRAVCEDPINGVAERWGVQPHQVKQWRRAIAGTDTGVETAIALKRANPAFREKFWTA
jgi:hypothetical protein